VDGAVLADEMFVLRYFTKEAADERLLLINLGPGLIRSSFAEPLLAPPAGYKWRTRWSSEAPEYGGGGAPDVSGPNGWFVTAHSAVVLQPEKSDGGDGTTRH
jgi:maltooligosyltrehalose trehalohydrolase